jgi:hypothetical protein
LEFLIDLILVSWIGYLDNTNDRGFDANLSILLSLQVSWVCIFSENGNALLGLTYKYKWSDQINIYGHSWRIFLGD